MRNDIIEYLESEVEVRCRSENNAFGIGILYHIRAVADYARRWADEYQVDNEVVIIAAWLHDIASITDIKLYEEHHFHGQQMAEEILRRFSYEEEKIFLVKKCILNHRGSRLNEKNTPEEQCVADADAASHFESVPSLLYLAYGVRHMELEEGMYFVKRKLIRSFAKLSDRGKDICRNAYQDAMKLLGGPAAE